MYPILVAITKCYQIQKARKTNESALTSLWQCSSTQVLAFNASCAWMCLWNGWLGSFDLSIIFSPTGQKVFGEPVLQWWVHTCCLRLLCPIEWTDFIDKFDVSLPGNKQWSH